ncbi:MAG: lipid A deacylase LpxR family protein [Betaproteobacteria bacterium]|nr:lipid A deacylase LpxR family protein [Betaproteobacteria bacterium]
MVTWLARGLQLGTRAAAAALLVSSGPGAAEPSPLECDRATACEFQLYIENDSAGGGTDRYYTNGIKFGGGVNADRLIERLFQAPAETVLKRFSDNPGDVHVGLFLGQHMYTPKRITVAAPQPFDRPWAAWLYLGGVAQSVAGNRLQTVEFDVGVVGPAALGKEVQTAWHELVGADRPQGWSNQIRNEPGVLLAYLEKWRFGVTNGVEVVPHFGASVGNVMTLARAGGIVRAGRNMSGFGPDTIEPGGAMLQRVRLQDVHSQNDGREWYAFAGVDLRGVARNIFLDGNLFRSSPSVDRREFVYDLKAGLSVRIPPARVSLTQIWRSEEFTTPLGGGGNQRFQSLNLSWEF